MFGSKKQYGVPVAVFDISSSSVGGAHALVKVDKGHLPTILASSRIEAPLQEDLDMKRFVADTVQNLNQVIEQLHKADTHHPHHIELVLASPWYISQTRTITYKKDTPVTCTRKLFNSLVDEEIQHVIENELSRFGTFGKEGTVVEKQVSLIKLNGYATSNPFGKKAKIIEIYLTVTVVPKKIVEQFSETLRRGYGTRHVSITTSPYTTFVVARDYFNSTHECVVIDIGEEVTDVAFVKGGLFLYQHSFPVGTYGLYRTLMDKKRHTALEARAVIEGYRLSKVSATARTKIDKALGEFSTQWQTALQEVLNGGYYGFCLPDTCYIVADPRFEGVFPGIIASDPFIQHTCSRGIVTPVFIGEEKLATLITSLDQEIDVPLGIAVLFVGRII